MSFLGIGDNNGQNSGMGFGVIGTALGGMAAGLYGNQAQNAANSYQSDHQMDRQEYNAQQQMGFQKMMSDTAYQRAVKDMRQAGINPMMAAMTGGASTPSGASGGGGGAHMVSPTAGIASTAMDALRLGNETKTAESQQALNHALGAKAVADTAASGASAKQMEASTKTIESQLKAIQKEADVRSIKADYDKNASQYDAVMSRVNRDSGSVRNLMNILGSPKNPSGSILMNGQTGEILKQF